jgi:hypothetical protein
LNVNFISVLKALLAPDVQVRRRGNTYIIYYDHDEVGGVVVSETPSGDTQLRPHVKEPVELNKDIVALVAQRMVDALIEHAGRQPDGTRHFSPDPIPGTALLENTTFPCSLWANNCPAGFCPGCASEAEMVSLGERLRNDVRYAPYPVWLIGAPDSDDDSCPAPDATAGTGQGRGISGTSRPDEQPTGGTG